MGRLFLKFYSILALVVALYFVGVANLDTLLKSTLERYYSGLAEGTFYLLEEHFSTTPSTEWPALVAEANQGNGFAMRLINIESLALPPRQVEHLNQGAMVVAEVYDASYSYKRILNSEWVLEFPFEQSEYSHNQRLSNSTFNLIERRLQSQPQTEWLEIIANLDQHFAFPVAILPLEEAALPDNFQPDLQSGKIVWQKIDDATDYLYRRIADTPYLIKMGPFDEPVTLNYLGTILVMTLALLVALAVLFWVYPLWRDLKRLGVTAEAFGEGDFSVRAQLSKRSVLHHLATTFDGMAKRIQRLISSHKELTNAVSHELRTPIARLRFGMEMLQSSTSEEDRARYLHSMNADIDELDQLVAELLTYARFDRDKPALKLQRQLVEPWLTGVIRQARIGKDELPIDCKIDQKPPTYASFEPRLMARALGNLLQNARRYAQTQVHVTFTSHHGRYWISVDDDGPGIPEQERKHIFEAFKRLDVSRDRESGGYGLGLAIVQRISQWHGGETTVEPSPFGGARFVISWPENVLSDRMKAEQ